MRLGVKAAPHDVHVMRDLDHVTFVETVLFHGDMADLPATAHAYQGGVEVIVHAPFTVQGGHDLDVAATDPAIRRASCEAWAATMRLADLVDAKKVILHPGGIRDMPADAGRERADALQHLDDALAALADEHGRDRLLMENMPSHYHRGDGRTARSVLGQGVLDLQAWRDMLGGFCLDTSHAWLTPGGALTLDAFFARAPRDIRHLHLSDARAPDHEGLPFGDGDIPWDRVRDAIRATEAENGVLTAVAEVKGGHAQDGEGFRTALDFLATHFG